MMYNKFVNIETAKLLEEKGYDIACSHIYTPLTTDGNYKLSDRFPKETIDSICKIKNNEMFDEYLAPSLDDVKNWLLEKHNISVEVSPNFNKDKLCFRYIILNIANADTFKKSFSNNISDMIYNYKSYDTYNEAYIHGIDIALKNI